MDKNLKVCVIGGAGYLGSALVGQLLKRGYTVHATLRNLGERYKVELLKGLPGAESRLVLFQADIYTPEDYAPAIEGCRIVYHIATPLQHNTLSSNNQYKNTTEAAVAAVKSIAEFCLRSGTVKRLIYTASVVAASPLKDDVTAGYKDSMDETCWTPLHRPFAFSNDILLDYTKSKTLAEKEVMKYAGDKLEVISLACGLVGGNALQHSTSTPESLAVLISQNLKHKNRYGSLRFLEELNGKVPFLHLHDVTAAHIFCMENSALVTGRFLCASAFLKSSEIASLLQKCQPNIKIDPEFIEDTRREIKWGSSKLEDFGFEYKYVDAELILSDSIDFMTRISDSMTQLIFENYSNMTANSNYFEGSPPTPPPPPQKN